MLLPPASNLQLNRSRVLDCSSSTTSHLFQETFFLPLFYPSLANIPFSLARPSSELALSLFCTLLSQQSWPKHKSAFLLSRCDNCLLVPHRIAQHDIIIKVNELLCQTRNAMKMGLDRRRRESRKMRSFGEELCMCDDGDMRMLGVEPGGDLSIRHNENVMDPWCKAVQGANRVAQFIVVCCSGGHKQTEREQTHKRQTKMILYQQGWTKPKRHENRRD